jgi:hypothetical protein
MRRLSAAERADRRARSELLPSEARRNVRMRDVPSRTENTKGLGKRQLLVLAAEAPEDALTVAMRAARPRTRGDCANGPRPCPWASCRYHLALEVLEPTGNIKFNFPDAADDFSDLPATCALDVADLGGALLETVGVAMNMTRERVRQLEGAALSIIHPDLTGHADEPEQMGSRLAGHIAWQTARDEQRADPEYRAARAAYMRQFYTRNGGRPRAKTITQPVTVSDQGEHE